MGSLAWETVYMSACVFAIGYGLHYFAYLRGLANEDDVVQSSYLEKTVDGKKQKYKSGNTFIDKWLDFGGGYYGVVAVVTLLFIEIGELRQFIADWQDLDTFIQSLGIGWLINFFIEQFMNFISAAIWIVHYIGDYSAFQVGIFIGATYVAYNISRKLARAQVNKVLADNQ
ncbi:MAG: hypothetical protein GJ680_04970 [Alteromonadaceae bacterium]|nr:hypothetical protein [Alteromonadaceae bacterium]